MSKTNFLNEPQLAVVESGSQGQSKKRWQSPRDKNYIKSVTVDGRGKLKQKLFVFDGKNQASASLALEMAGLDGGKLSMFSPCRYVDLPLVGHRRVQDIAADLASAQHDTEEWIALDDEMKMLKDRYS